jgi:hypothetical protein
MDADDRPGPEFEEQAALRELEQVQEALEQSRRRRREANDAFDSFIRSFAAREEPRAPLTPPPDPVPAEPVAKAEVPPIDAQPDAIDWTPSSEPIVWAPPPETVPPESVSPPPVSPVSPELLALDPLFPGLSPEPVFPGPVSPEPISSAPELLEHTAPPLPPPVANEIPRDPPRLDAPIPAAPPKDDGPVVPAALVGAPKRRRPLMVGMVATAIVGAALVIGWSVQLHDAAIPTDRSATPTPTSGAPAPTPPPPAPVEIPAAELTTIRAVWVRVSVDGEVTIERELPANARIPLTASRQIDIRVGDAGALRVSIAGKDQGQLGGDGQVVTRRFPIAASDK